MSSDFYFQKWKITLRELEKLVEFDVYLQTTKVKEQVLCVSAIWVTGLLARYIMVYKEISTCLVHNTQVQKIEYYEAVAKSIENRMIELKKQLTKLESSPNRFYSIGLICYKLTPFDIEPTEFCIRTADSIKKKAKLKEVFEVVKKRKEEEELLARQQEIVSVDEKWWEDDASAKKSTSAIDLEVKKKTSLTELERLNFIKIIQAQERSRQIVKTLKQGKQRREMWVKELEGTLHPPAPLRVRERAAELIQTIARKYFEFKRKKILDCKRDELLGLQFCQAPKLLEQYCSNDEKLIKKYQRKTNYTNERDETHNKLKALYAMKKVEDLRDDHRDFLRYWFRTWYDQAKFFLNIPDEKQGGSTLILKEEVLTPCEWVKQYEVYMEEKEKNKKKTEYEKMAEKMAAKREKQLQKKFKSLKKQKNNLAEMCYEFPISITVPEIEKAISKYHDTWDDYDKVGLLDVKERFVKNLELVNAIANIKEKVCYEVDDRMRNELKLLKKALKADYENQDEETPEPMKTKKKKMKKNKKKPEKPPPEIDETIFDGLVELAAQGYLKEYPKTYFDDNKGDHNFIGDDIRCMNRLAQPHAGEFRNIWWDRCRQAAHEFQRILLVGPTGSGRATLARILATAIDATFYEFDPREMQNDPTFSAETIEELITTAVLCIKATQPVVIFIRHVENMYLKTSDRELKDKSTIMKETFIKKLCKFKPLDKITVIASCSNPWDAKMAEMQKRFDTVYVTPNTTYACVSQMLQDWVVDNRVVPADFQISALAYMLQGYQYSFLKDTLNNYLTGVRLTSILARGLDPQEVHNYVLECANEFAIANKEKGNEPPTTNYDKYWDFYLRTALGKKESKHQKDQMELAEQRKKLAEKEEKKKRLEKKKMASNVSSMMSTIPE